jgi:hypothetical protein
MKHCHEHECAHKRVQYCAQCKNVYCLDCKTEWGRYNSWPWYTYTTTTAASVIGINPYINTAPPALQPTVTWCNNADGSNIELEHKH